MEIFKSLKTKQKKTVLIAIAVSVAVVVAGFIYDFGIKDIAIREVVRPKAYENDRDISFDINIKGGEEDEKIKYSGRVGNIKLTESEIMNYINSALNTVEKNLFREGESSEAVKTGLNIPHRVRQNPVKIDFSTTDKEIFLENGNINFKNVREVRKVELILKGSYNGQEAERKYILTVYPKNLTGIERVIEELPEKINKVFESDENEVVKLPEEIDGYKIMPFIKGKKVTGKILGFVVFTIMTLFVLFNESNKREIKNRQDELNNGYTDFIGRFVILLGAGLNISTVWKKLESSFKSNKSLSREIVLTLGEINNGKTEREAYENFGKRIGGTQYTKFASILTQSLKMGSSQILVRLEAESTAAMFERRNSAKVRGEIADKKLLMPMMLQLLLIMSVIMIPALVVV